jgi:outer membrane receptor protein involved in Fe transport
MEKIYLKIIVSFFMIIVLDIHTTLAQDAAIEGVVIEQSEHLPIEFSTVSVYRAQDSTMVSGAVSDARGKFSITNLKAGEYYVLVNFLGYESKKISAIHLSNHQKLDLGTTALVAQQKLLDEIVVTGQRATAYHQIDKQVYTAAQFQSSQGGTAVDVLRNLPSVSVNSEGDITMRGSSGFIVLLDGKPTQADPLVILNQLPANTIENVEIITTPSSKYDPDGKAGIINITTKKGTTDGYYILLNAQAGLPSVEDYGNEKRPARFGGDVTAHYKKEKWNLSLGANYKRDDIAGYRNGDAKTYLDNVYTNFPSLGERSYESYAYSVKGTANYQIDNTNTIEAGFYGGKRSQFRKANIVYDQTRIDESTGAAINSLTYFNKNLRERKGDFIVSNLDYNHTFKNKATIFVSTLYERTILGGPTDNADVNPAEENQVYNHAVMKEDNPLDGARIKTDFTLPVRKKGKFEGGYQYRYLLHKGNFRYSELNTTTGNWHFRPALSNKIKLTRHIHSWYSQYAGEAGKLTYNAGLRLEYVDRTLKDEDTPDPYKFERANLFPSANLLYTAGKGLKLKAGYSRRISHTTSNMMNPFPARRHSEVFETGDPNLLPEYIGVTETGIVKDFSNHSVFVNIYHRHTQNVINRVNAVYNDTILIRTYTNAGSANAVGMEAGADVKIAEWWTLFAGGNVYRYTIKGGVFNARVNRSSTNYSINANTTLKFLSTVSLQLTVSYTSATATAQGEDSRFLIPSATLKKTVFEGHGSVSLQWQNIDLGLLETNEQRMTTAGDGYYTSTNYIQEVDIFRVNFSYQLNKLTKKLKFTESEFGEKEF